MYNRLKEKMYVYNSLKKIVVAKKKRIWISSITRLYDDYFLIIDCLEKYLMSIFHYDIIKNDLIFDQFLHLPSLKTKKMYGYSNLLYCCPLNETFITFHWKTTNNFCVYKNKSSKKDVFKFEFFTNFQLEKKAFVYEYTELEQILKIKDNELLIFAVSKSESLEVTTYIGIYSYNKKIIKFILEKSKVCYDVKCDYDICLNRCILRERFFIYSGINKTEKHIQIFDLKLMEIITVIKGDRYNFQFFNINRNNKILFFSYFNSSSSSYTLKQYEMNKNGHLKQIGEIKYKRKGETEIIDVGTLYNGKGDDKLFYRFYRFIHE